MPCGDLDDPALAGLFGPGSRAEIPLAGIIGDVEIGGLVDRLAVTEDCVTLADFKTDRAPPAQVAEIPGGDYGDWRLTGPFWRKSTRRAASTAC